MNDPLEKLQFLASHIIYPINNAELVGISDNEFNKQFILPDYVKNCLNKQK